MRMVDFISRLPGVALAALLVSAAPAMAARWVPGHYDPWGRWHPPHWVGGIGRWIPGHYVPGGWVPGHWVGGYGPPPGPYEAPPPGAIPPGQHWQPGFYDGYGRWHPGFWVRG